MNPVNSIRILDLRCSSDTSAIASLVNSSFSGLGKTPPVQFVQADQTLRRFHRGFVEGSREGRTIILADESSVGSWRKLIRSMALSLRGEELLLILEGEAAPKSILDLVRRDQIQVTDRRDLPAVVLSHLRPAESVTRSDGYEGSDPEGVHGFVGKSSLVKKVLAFLPKIAESDLPVLITGETGTGKEVLARAIHLSSPRRSFPFVQVNMASIPTTLAENELFGHAAEAYTTANAGKPGLIASAGDGTLFLDEIDSMPTHAQATLLGFLERKEYRPLGGTKSLRANVRIICATNADLDLAVRSGAFRQDLLYRVNTFHIHLPPLRDRKEDIPILVNHFLRKHSGEGKAVSLSDETLVSLLAHSWPGNVRELEHIVQRSLALSDGDELGGLLFVGASITDTSAPSDTEQKIQKSIKGARILQLLSVLSDSGGNVSLAARKLGLNRTSIYRLLAKYNVDYRLLSGK